MIDKIAALPRALRIGLFALATAILLYLCLAPVRLVPGSGLFWDKWEHLSAWFVLTVTGLLLAPRRARSICLFAVGLGVGVELLQATMGFGRDGDWLDLVADSLGVASAAVMALIVRHVRMR